LLFAHNPLLSVGLQTAICSIIIPLVRIKAICLRGFQRIFALKVLHDAVREYLLESDFIAETSACAIGGSVNGYREGVAAIIFGHKNPSG
jgi:hypothetical protein